MQEKAYLPFMERSAATALHDVVTAAHSSEGIIPLVEHLLRISPPEDERVPDGVSFDLGDVYVEHITRLPHTVVRARAFERTCNSAYRRAYSGRVGTTHHTHGYEHACAC